MNATSKAASENKTPRRAAIYVRVSTDDQSVATQLGDLRRLVEQREWVIVDVYSDEGVSGSKDRRPALDRMMSAVRTRQVDVVVVWALDRLGRSLSHLIKLSEEFRVLGVDLVVATQPVDTTSPVGTLVFQILGAVGEFERELIRARVKAGVKRARAAGKPWGRARRATPELVKKAQALRRESKSWRTVAMSVGLPSRTIRRAVDEAEGKVTRKPTGAKTSQ